MPAVLHDAIEQVCVDLMASRTMTEDQQKQAVQEVEASEDLLALSDWIAAGPLARQFCQHPECFRPPRPKGEMGPPPRYCDLEHPTIPGKYAHDRHSSAARRKALLAERDRRRATAAAVQAEVHKHIPPAPTELTAQQRPVTTTLDTLPATVDDIARTLRNLSTQVQQLTQDLGTVADPVSKAAEIEAISRLAESTVRDAEMRADAAQRTAERAVADAKAARVHIDEAHESAQEAVADARQARAAFSFLCRTTAVLLTHAHESVRIALQAQEDALSAQGAARRAQEDAQFGADEARLVAQWLVAEDRWTTDQEVAAARAAFDVELRSLTERMQGQIDQAGRDRAAALADAERASQSTRDAETERTRVAAELAELRTKYETAIEQHVKALESLRGDYDARLAKQTEQIRAALEQTYQAVVEGLRATNQQLTVRAERAERQLDAAGTTMAENHGHRGD